MPRFLSSLNNLGTNYAGLIGLLQFLGPIVTAGALYVFVLWLDSNYVNQDDYQKDKARNEKVFEEIKGKLNLIINNQTAFSTQLNGVNAALIDHSERLRFLERKETMVKR